MTKDILVRGVDEEIYSSIGNAAKEKGISMNSLVKDAIDSWLARKDNDAKIHHLVLYADNDSMSSLLRSLDYYAKKVDGLDAFLVLQIVQVQKYSMI